MKTIVMIPIIFWFAYSCTGLRILDIGGGANVFNVLDYGAVGDGKTESSQAFLKAWEDLCKATGNLPTLQVPADKTFLLQSIAFRGPCKSNQVHVQIQGTIVAPNCIQKYIGNKEKWLQFSDVDGLIIDGGGKIDGQGNAWWKVCQENMGCNRATALDFHNCNGLRLREMKHVNSQRNHISIANCNDVIFSDLKIMAPGESPNTDGIDISSSSNIFIENSMISTGDDCIAINNMCSHINITGITCGPGHGISIGSLGKNGDYATVEEIHVRNCTFIRTLNGARIKTWQGGKGYARKISFEQITVLDSWNPIIIDQHYLDKSLDNTNLDIHISDVTYQDVHGTSADEKAINLDCNSGGCSNIVMNNVNIVSSKPGIQVHAYCNNVYGTSSSATPNVPCLSR